MPMDLYSALMAQKQLGSGSGMPGAPANSPAPSQGAGAPSMPAPIDLNMALAQNDAPPNPTPTQGNPFQGLINQGSAGKDKAVIDSINAGGLGKMRS